MADRVVLFDGTTAAGRLPEGQLPDGWRMAGPGGFEVVDGANVQTIDID